MGPLNDPAFTVNPGLTSRHLKYAVCGENGPGGEFALPNSSLNPADTLTNCTFTDSFVSVSVCPAPYEEPGSDPLSTKASVGLLP